MRLRWPRVRSPASCSSRSTARRAAARRCWRPRTARRRRAGCRFPWARRARCRRAGRRCRSASRRRRWRAVEVGDRFFDLRDARRFVPRRRACCRRGRVGRLSARRRVAVERVGRGVVDRQGVAVVEDLRVAFFGLQLQAHAPVLGDPQPAGARRTAAGWRRAAAASPPAPARLAPSSRWSVSLTLALTPSTGAAARASCMACASGLGAGVGPRAEREGDSGRRDAERDHQAAQQQQAGERESAQDVHELDVPSVADTCASRLAP